MRQGFSSIELLIILIILTLTLSLCYPDWSKLMIRLKAQILTLQLYHTFSFARSEAIKRNQMVKVCSMDWSKGYQVSTMDDDLLRHEALNTQLSIQSGKLTVIKYSSDGRCLTRGSLLISHQGKNYYKIVLYDSGRARIEQIKAHA